MKKKEEWINDTTYHCDRCDTTFKVYCLNNDPSVNFCPNCANREIEYVEENDIKPKTINCDLVNIVEENNKSKFLLQDIKNEIHSIEVDESIKRITECVRQVIEGKREYIYLSRCMVDIDINTKGNRWDINEETSVYYTFDKSDIIKILKIK